MQLSSEGVRSRWTVMACTWLLVVAALFIHAETVGDYLKVASQLGLRGGLTAGTPLQQTYPGFAADAQTWVRHAIALTEGSGPQLRFTTIDNAPAGREVHWNSAWAWLIAGSGLLDHWLTGRPIPQAIEHITVWLPATVLAILTVLMSAWAARQAGALAGVVTAIAMIGHPRVFEGFFPTYVDHHGILTVAVLGMVFGATLMGAGWWEDRPEGSVRLLPRSAGAARRAAVVSACCGALGLWISAASVIPPIGIVAVAALAALLVQGRRAQKSGATFDGQAWRLWGRVGGAVSVFFYLIEYFPFHLGFRLESNHPFYALAWWGGGELIARLGEEWLGQSEGRGALLRSLALPLVAIAVAPVAILLGGTRVFVVADPFLSQLHSRYIQEFLPLWRTIHGMGWKTFFSVVGAENLALILGLLLISIRGKKLPIVIWFGTVAALLFTGMAWMQSRWLLNASGAQVGLTLLVIGYLLAEFRPVARWSLALLAAGLIFVPSTITRVMAGREDVEARRVSPKDAQAALWRDVARALRESQPTGEITLLTSPNSSTAVGYYGRFKTLGTLYWENSAGLKSAAAILAAKTADEAAQLIKQHGITHIAIISEEHFIDSYHRLLHPEDTDTVIRRNFGFQLLLDRVVPTWLQMLPYVIPEDLKGLNVTVMLFKVAFDQTPADALYHIAMAKAATGALTEAEKDFDTLIRQTPISYQPWLRKGELLFGRQDWDGAAAATIAGIQRAPHEERLALFASAAGAFYRQRLYAQTARVYRAALEERFVPQFAAYLAFVLATAKDEKIRNGVEAQALAERALQLEPDSATTLNALAAALAENGDFTKASEIGARALASARLAGDEAARKVTEARIASFQAHKPWRE